MPIVRVPGKGNIKFPDDMTPYQIQLVIEREILPGKKPETISAPKQPEATIGSFLRGVGKNAMLGLENAREFAKNITPGELVESGLTTAGQILTAPQVLQNRLFEAAGLREKAPPPPPPSGPRVSQIVDQALGLGSPEERARKAAEDARRAAIYGEAATRTPGEQRRLSQQAVAAEAKPKFETILGEGLYSGATSLAQMAPGVGLSLLTRSAAPALASAGLTSASDQYFNVLDRGGTKEEAMQAAQLTGATEVATEILPMGVVLNSLGKVGVGKFLRDYLGKDLPTELVATITQNAIDTAIANPDKTWAEYFNELPRDLGVTAISTLVPGAALATTGKGLEIASRLAERGAPEDEIAAALQGASTETAAPRSAPRPPSPPADMGALSQALGPVGGKITLQEPSGPQEYTYQGLDEDGSVLLADADGQVFAEDPDQIAAAMQVGAVAPEETGGGIGFGMDITEGLEEPVVAEPEAAVEPEPVIEAAPAPEESIAPPEPKIFPVDKEVASYMDEYSRFRSADQMNQIMAMATDLAREKGKRSISRDELFNAAMQFDDQMAARGRPAPKQPPAPAQPAQMSPEDAKELADEQDFLERLEDDLAYISETRAENAYEGEDPETKAAYEQDIAELEASRQERLRNIEAIKAKYAAPAAPAAPTGLQDLQPELERIMGKFHPQLREMFILPKIQEKIASGERFTVKDIPDALRKNIPQADRLIVARALAENPQQLVDVANAVPFTTPVGDVVYPTAAQPQAEAAPEVAPPAPPAAIGKTAKARVPSTMQKVDVQYELQDLGNIRFAEGDLQNRDRSRPQTQQFLRDFTSTFDPEALGEDNATDRGAPIINKDNTILSGNGRTMGLEEIYDNYPEQAEAYRNFLREQGYNIEGMERPVLVRRLLSDVDERQFVVGSNVADIAALSPPELARQDAQDILTPEVLATYYGGDLKAAKNDAFVGRFIAKLSAKERGDAMDAKGNPSAQVLQRIRNALLYKAYGESGKASEIFISKAMERADDDTKTLTNALIEAANDWIKFQREIAAGNIDPKYDITDKLMEAVAAVSDIKERGLKVRDYLRSEDLVEPLDPFVKDILLAFHNDNVSRFVGKNVISGMLSNYAETAADQQAAPDMLGMAETPSAGEIWRRIDRETDKSPKAAKDQGQMFQPSERSYIKVENNAQVMEVLDTGTPEQMKNAIAQAQKPDDKSNQIGADAQKKNRGCD